jgi:hypothetical protein
MSKMETTAYLHRVDSSTSPRVIIIRQGSFKVKPMTSINTPNVKQNPQQLSTIVTSGSTPKKRRKSLFKYVRKKSKKSFSSLFSPLLFSEYLNVYFV